MREGLSRFDNPNPTAEGRGFPAQERGGAMADLFDKCLEFTAARDAVAKGNYPYFNVFQNHEGTVATLGGREVIMCGSNNYLGLTTHPSVVLEAMQALAAYGPSCTGSRLLTGTLQLHVDLERGLADYIGKPAALVFPTGYQTNVGSIAALLGRNDVAVIDKEAHTSIIDGCRLGFGRMRRFAHNDMLSLERQLRACPPEAGKLVVVDGVYSMGGDLAPLPEVVELCRRYKARLMVDDAHGIGVLAGGRGTVEHFGLTGEVDLIMITFSKAFASLGGALIGSEEVIDFIKHRAHGLVFSASTPAASAAAALAALRIIRADPSPCDRVMRSAARMREGLRALGFDTGASQTPIVPIITGDIERTFTFWKVLLDAGVFTNAVIPPAAPTGRLRTSYMATHTEEQLARVLDIFAWAGRKLGLIPHDAANELVTA
jgi:8-amino-7-oxononanoate synthase